MLQRPASGRLSYSRTGIAARKPLFYLSVDRRWSGENLGTRPVLLSRPYTLTPFLCVVQIFLESNSSPRVTPRRSSFILVSPLRSSHVRRPVCRRFNIRSCAVEVLIVFYSLLTSSFLGEKPGFSFSQMSGSGDVAILIVFSDLRIA